MTTISCCAECGEEGGASLKTCKSCMTVKYCNAECQRNNHWPKHKKECKIQAAKIRDEALFKDPPPKEDCPICFLPMPRKMICCVSLPDATRSSVPINDCVDAHEEWATKDTEEYHLCCGKSICKGCVYSCWKSGNGDKCPFCNSAYDDKTEEERVEEIMRRVEASNPAAICMLACYYQRGFGGLQQDHANSSELYARAADLGCIQAHCKLGDIYYDGGDLKKAKFHYEAAAMSGDENARSNLGNIEGNSGNMERAVKHFTIAASFGHYHSMHQLTILFQHGAVSRESIDSTLTAYNNTCAEFRSEARDAYIREIITDTILSTHNT